MLNTYRKASRKGSTLTEMTVVLALVGIVSLLVVSFTLMVHTRSITAATKNRIADDLRMSKIVIENWIDEVTNTYDTEVAVSGDKKSLVATIDGVVYKTILTEDGFNATLPDDKTLGCPIGEIKEFKFEESKKVEDGKVLDAIWFCTAQYLLPDTDGKDSPQQTTFCINSHIGDAAN